MNLHVPSLVVGFASAVVVFMVWPAAGAKLVKAGEAAYAAIRKKYQAWRAGRGSA